MNEEINVIKADDNAINGQNKCPNCGATDISLNVKTGKLRCNYCRSEFEPQKTNAFNTDLNNLNELVVGAGASDISKDASDVLTLKCSSCGAEVVIDTSSALQARCHWCRNTLSINQQIPNGSVPDLVLPFALKKEDAQAEIKKFVDKRSFFANPVFKKEFTTNNIMGVYLPYMLVSSNAHSHLIGEAEIEKRRYYRGSGDNKKEYYDADLYHVERDFDIIVNDLSVESSSEKLTRTSSNTNNVINAIMPFDTENCVKFDANYLKGYTSEKRDTNIDDLRGIVESQTKDIARIAANDSLGQYNRGVRWDSEQLDLKGQQWKSAYLPIWLYSYQQVKGNKKLLHYVAVNARTKETMGSVPIHMPKLLFISFLVEILGSFLMLSVDWDYSWLFLSLGFIYYFFMHSKYRNASARHFYEKETKRSLSNLKSIDDFIKTEKELTNYRIRGCNNSDVSGNNSFGKKIVNSVIKDNEISSIINKTINK